MDGIECAHHIRNGEVPGQSKQVPIVALTAYASQKDRERLLGLGMIELTNEIVRRFNRVYQCDVLVEAEAVVPKTGRLPGIDGKAKMSKSLGNAINLKATTKEIAEAVKMMFTDPGHLRIDDPGKTEGNVVFAYLDVFDPAKAELEELKAHYRRGGLGDGVVKKRLNGILQDVLAPIRAERERLAKDPAEVIRAVIAGTEKGREVVARTLAAVKAAMMDPAFVRAVLDS